MRKIDRIFNLLFLIIISLLTVASLAAIFIIHWNFGNSMYSFSFTPSGINFYLNAYADYKALFTGTVATIAGYYGLHRMTVAADANAQKIKQDKFSEWKTVLDIRWLEVEKKDPFMKREFTRIRSEFYEILYSSNFEIRNLEQLKAVFEPVFGNLIQFFEEQNEMMIELGGAYPHSRYAYSFDSFRFIFLGSAGYVYDEIIRDLENLYLEKLPPLRLIDELSYKSALLAYLKRPR